MAQTPISASANYNGTTPTTLYTVPAGATAVVKTVVGSSLIGTFDTVTVNKVSGGIVYPLIQNKPTGYGAATGYPQVLGENLLSGPITLAANDVLSISTSTSANYKFITTVITANFPTYRVYNTNYFNSTYIAVGFDASNGNGLVLTSTDAVTWTKQNFPFGIQLTDIAFDGTNYVVVGIANGNFLYYSTNLTSWTQVAAPNSSDMYSVTYGNSKFVAGGVSGVIWYATSPTSTWSTATLPEVPTINSVLTIGTSWAFGTTGSYVYTSDFSTFISPYYFRPTNAVSGGYQSFAVDDAGKIYAARSGGNPNANPTNALWSSTNSGISFTAIDLSALGSLPTQPAYPFVFGNGGRMAWMAYHPSNSRYLASADGVTWTSQAYTGTNGTAASTWYSMNGAGRVSTSYNYLMSYLDGVGAGGNITLGTVSSSGIFTLGIAFNTNETQFNPSGYGTGAMAASAFNGEWNYASTNVANTNYPNVYYGTSMSNGSTAQMSSNIWYMVAYGTPSCACGRPGRTGFLFGTSAGYIIYTNTYNTATTVITTRVMPDNGQIVAIVASGTATNSKIMAITTSGYIATSTDTGITWTYVSRISAGFSGTSLIGGSKNLHFVNGVWYAFDDNSNIYVSTDTINWTSNPLNIVSMYTLNSNNIFIKSSAGITYTTGTSLDTFVNPTSISFDGGPSVRRMAYVNSTYVIGGDGRILTSTNLTDWTSNSISNKQINNITFYSPLGSGLASIMYTGAGSNIVVGNAIRAIGNNAFSMSQPTAFASAKVTGAATAGIVEIS
jgi:hypothetical protein